MNFFYKLFFVIPNFKNFGFAGKVLNKIISKLFFYIINHFANKEYRNDKQAQISQLNKEKRNIELIISLTAIPSRIDNVWITIESLFRQTYKPDRIMLWITKEEFGENKLPVSLLELQKKGLEICFGDNLRPHNKYYHTMVNNPNANVITVDDDIIYPENMIANLIQMHNKYPKAVCANLTSLITYKNGKLLPYVKWKEFYKKALKPTNKIIQLGVSGVLYPPNVLPTICFDKELIKQLSLGADDIWLNSMCLINKTLIVTNKTFNRYFLTVKGSQKISLFSINSTQGRNDTILKNVHKYFNINVSDYEREV